MMPTVRAPKSVKDGAVSAVGVAGAASPLPPQAASAKPKANTSANTSAEGIPCRRTVDANKASAKECDASKAPANRSLPTHNAPFNRTGTEGAANADTASDARGAQAADTSPEST
ncbi:MAG: hypothetical protein K0U66_11220, partial [Gammaproteobacteria bacterium]|nr:hypothetical protein [Gammaproteobacteria bacterium]